MKCEPGSWILPLHCHCRLPIDTHICPLGALHSIPSSHQPNEQVGTPDWAMTCVVAITAMRAVPYQNGRVLVLGAVVQKSTVASISRLPPDRLNPPPCVRMKGSEYQMIPHASWQLLQRGFAAVKRGTSGRTCGQTPFERSSTLQTWDEPQRIASTVSTPGPRRSTGPRNQSCTGWINPPAWECARSPDLSSVSRGNRDVCNAPVLPPASGPAFSHGQDPTQTLAASHHCDRRRTSKWS